jgi:hypothetical protein
LIIGTKRYVWNLKSGGTIIVHRGLDSRNIRTTATGRIQTYPRPGVSKSFVSVPGLLTP